MSGSMVLAVWLVQAPMVPSLVPVTPPPREWKLAGNFTLKQDTFLRWQPVVDPARPYKGLYAEPRMTRTLELTHPKISLVSLMIESLPAREFGVGVVRPKLVLRIPGTQVRLSLGVNVWAARGGARR